MWTGAGFFSFDTVYVGINQVYLDPSQNEWRTSVHLWGVGCPPEGECTLTSLGFADQERFIDNVLTFWFLEAVVDPALAKGRSPTFAVTYQPPNTLTGTITEAGITQAFVITRATGPLPLLPDIPDDFCMSFWGCP